MFQTSNVFTFSVCGISALVLELVLTNQFAIYNTTHVLSLKKIFNNKKY